MKKNPFIFLMLAVFLTTFCPLAFSAERPNSIPLETVKLQLKWFHQFQFAGYYAAKEQGYYAAEGLDVEIMERSPDQTVIDQVLSGEAEYGIGDAGILVNYANGAPIMALAAIFQHSPLVFISKQDSGIISPYEMIGKRIMFDFKASDDAPFKALLADTGLDENRFIPIEHSFKNEDLITGKVDVMSAYLTNEPFFFKQNNIPLNIINPQNYGIDFYGDLLFTSQEELAKHPVRAERFRRASLKGWRYALDHSEELVQLIHTRYRSRSSLEHLRYEAQESRKLILPDIIPIGHIEVNRLRRVAEIYRRLGLSQPISDIKLNKFIYAVHPSLELSKEEQTWLEQHPIIRVGIDRDFAPYEWIDEQGEHRGMIADYLRLIEQRLDVRFDIVKDKPWPEILAMAERGELDMLTDAAKTPNRERYLTFTAPLFHHPIVIITTNSKDYIGNLNNLKGKRVAVERGYFMQELLVKDFPEIQVVPLDGVRQALRYTAEGKVDAYVGHAASASYIMKLEGMMQLSFSGETGYFSDHTMAVTKANPLLHSVLEKALASIPDYERNTIQNYWMNLKAEPGIRTETALQYGVAIVLLFSLFLYWVYRLRNEVNRRRLVESALRQSEAKLLAILEAEPECVKITDSDCRLLYINRSGLALIEAGNDPSLFMGQPVTDLIVAEDRQAFIEMNQHVLRQKEAATLEYRIEGLKGTLRHMETHAVPFQDHMTGEYTVLSVTRDVSERKQNQEQLLLASRVFSEAREGITITDSNGTIIDVNPTFCEITGYSREEAIGRSSNILKSHKQGPEFYKAMWKNLTELGHWQGEIWNRKKSGELYAELLTISALRDATGKTINYIGLFSDITQSKHQQKTLELMAHYDPLTQLPNRVLFADRFAQAIAHSKRTGSLLAICYLDLDGFKQVNDTWGHEAGDQLLIEVAQCIKSLVREDDTVSRLGGDEFSLLLEDLESLEQCQEVLSRIHRALTEPFLIKKESVSIAASSGVTIFPQDNEQPDILLRHADQAMYQAKLEGRNRFKLYDPEHDQRTQNQRQQVNLLEQSLIQQEFCLHYQPKINIKTGAVIGAEALIRWNHPERGLLLPAEFLSTIEGTALEITFGNWVIREALNQLKIWQDQGLALQISINISPNHLQNKSFVKDLENTLALYPTIDSRSLELEVLETSALEDLISVGQTLQECYHRLGIPLALDDFGTGYSSLTHLRHLSVNAIKIDQTFVRDMIDDPDDLAIVEGIIGLTRAFKREVIAEGVETMEHGIILLNLGCCIAQGYGIARPMPADKLERWVKSYRPYQTWMEQGCNPLTAIQAQVQLLKIQLSYWIKRIDFCLLCGPNDKPHWPIMNPKNCHMGKWLIRAQEDKLVPKDLLAELEQKHQKQHRIGNKLMYQYQSGQKKNARETYHELVKVCAAIEQTLDRFEADGQLRTLRLESTS
ncbi:MAG: EAL domain-containing protein [Gammaproteobacteria bacterium]